MKRGRIMNGLSLSFRDLANHLFPGIIISFPIFYILTTETGLKSDLNTAMIFAFLIISYIIGFSVDSISKINRWANKAIRRSRGDPLKDIFLREGMDHEIIDPNTFERVALQIVQKRFGKNLLQNEHRLAILHYMLREIESKSNFLANFISRISALENMCRNLGLACILNAIIIVIYTIYSGKFVIFNFVLFFLFAGILLLMARDANRDWFGKVVVRGFVAVNTENFPLAGSFTKEAFSGDGPIPGSPLPAANPAISNPPKAGGDSTPPPSES